MLHQFGCESGPACSLRVYCEVAVVLFTMAGNYQLQGNMCWEADCLGRGWNGGLARTPPSPVFLLQHINHVG